MANTVAGDCDIRYRRHTADYLRVLVRDDDDENARKACARYVIAIQPAPPGLSTLSDQPTPTPSA